MMQLFLYYLLVTSEILFNISNLYPVLICEWTGGKNSD